ncbi:MAG: ribosome biogenesis GTPase Der [Ardenticatenia bacterium]|nr:ribosome biogenesis GTPase Der [Ardenticatenia bacterium]
MVARPIVAIVGRPNVGKSTLFNRIIGERKAIVEDRPGTTRDRLYGEAEWNGRAFIVVDTGGLLLQDEDVFAPHIRDQVRAAVEESDAILFLVDGREGLTAADEEIAELLRHTSKPVFLVVNKAETLSRRLDAVEFYAVGLGEPMPISALHGIGTGDLLDAVVARLPPAQWPDEEDESVHVAIVGRPNVGKSSLLNRLLGAERAIVSEQPGTTRDAVDTRLTWDGRPVTLIDTAGIRRRGRIERGVERYSVVRALRAIDRAHVALLVVDATEGITAQDTHIAGHIIEAYKSVVVVVNKWDAVQKDAYTMLEYEQRVRHALNFMDYVPVIFVSAKTGQRVRKSLDLAVKVYDERLVRLPTGELNRLIADAVARHSPPSEGRRKLRIRYVTQADVNPPTFVFFVNHVDLLHFSYERYLENTIRARYPFLGTPLRLIFRQGDGDRRVEPHRRRRHRRARA